MSDTPIQVPHLVSMVLCDRIILDGRTGQRCLIGLTNVVGAVQFPALHPTLAVYLALAGGRGKMPCEFRLVEEGSDRILLRLPGQLDFASNADLLELDLSLNGLQLARPGKLYLQFWADEKFIAERFLVIQQVQPQQQGQPGARPAGNVPTAPQIEGATTAPAEDKDFVIRVPDEAVAPAGN